MVLSLGDDKVLVTVRELAITTTITLCICVCVFFFLSIYERERERKRESPTELARGWSKEIGE